MRTNGDSNGIVNVSLSETPEHTESRVWVFVLRGQVGMGTGIIGGLGIQATSTKHYEWEELHARNVTSPVQEFIVYSTSPDGTWFFVAKASVIAI